MQALLEVVLEAGRSAVDIALYTLLPILVVMAIVERVLRVIGLLPLVERWCERPLALAGLPPSAALAMVELLLVSFAAPLLSLRRLCSEGASDKELGATLAVVLTMAQANVTFPLMADGLSLATVPISILGGIVAAMSTSYWFVRSNAPDLTVEKTPASGIVKITDGKFTQVMDAGQRAVRTSLSAIPFLLIGLTMMIALKACGAISALEVGLSQTLHFIHLPDDAALLIITKFLAGGTAMLGACHELLAQGSLTSTELNRMAGFLINPCDCVGIPVLMAAGPRLRGVLGPALLGTALGLIVRATIHLIVF